MVCTHEIPAALVSGATYIPEGEDRLLPVNRLDDLILPEAPEALAEHLAHADHYDYVHGELVQPLWKQSGPGQ